MEIYFVRLFPVRLLFSSVAFSTAWMASCKGPIVPYYPPVILQMILSTINNNEIQFEC